MTDRVVEYEVRGAVALIALNRPDRLNALSRELGEAIVDAFSEAEADDNVRVVVLHGRGRAFCAGADIGEARNVDGVVDAYRYLNAVRPTFERVASTPLPTIAALHGLALGGGLELALACDLRIASAGTKLGLPETKIGALPGGGGLSRLPLLVGPARAKEMVFCGEQITAETAREDGLVNRVVDGDHVDAAVDWAQQIAAMPAVALTLAKRVIDRGVTTDGRSASDLELLATTILFGTDDRREGMEAFLKKRAPRFGGR